MKSDALAELNVRIAELEAIRIVQYTEMGNSFQSILDNLKPINIIRKAFQDVLDLPKMKDGIGNLAIGSVSGMLAKRVLWGNSMNPVRMIMGIVTQTLVTNVATHHADDIRANSEKLIHPIIQRLLAYRKEHRSHVIN
jgi:hypothetical protein